jgi:hypothetical protein
MSREFILWGDDMPVFVSETGTRDEILPTVYLSETTSVGGGGGFVAAWAMNSNLPVLGTGTY